MSRPKNSFRYFDSSPEVICLVVMMYVRHPLSLRNAEDLLRERGIDIRHETHTALVEPIWTDGLRSDKAAMKDIGEMTVCFDSALNSKQRSLFYVKIARIKPNG